MRQSASGRGLSPPTRGNPQGRGLHSRAGGSIPAHAGEPRAGDFRRRRDAVYPRPRGGTARRMRQSASGRGLSPPTRGNPLPADTAESPAGSIPAHAGEPIGGRIVAGDSAVYPRPRGGTSVAERLKATHVGLSPPTRGNHSRRRLKRQTRWSIPAHAGEPPGISPSRSFVAVYPRPRGGTLFCSS